MKEILCKIITGLICIFLSSNYLFASKIIEERGGRVKVVKYSDGGWQLLVDGKPFFIKGVIFTPVKIGESPDNATMRDWMYYDDNNDGINDVAYQTWVDENGNNKKDPQEKTVGDFLLLKEMGCNTIRLYHVASSNPILGDIYKTNPSTALQFDHPPNKKLLRQLYQKYGIMVIIGNFLGSWTIGSGASWEEGTDYTNPVHIENIKKSVKAMVLEHKDEPYLLMWMLGNENNIAVWSRCNAKDEPQTYAKLIGELVDMIHKLDPQHPVAVCEGDSFNTLKLYAKYAPQIDVIAYNSYRGKDGFGNLWKDVKQIMDRPVLISEFGTPAYNPSRGIDEDFQLEYIKGCWKDIVLNSREYLKSYNKCAANSIGGIIFDWIDRWYMKGNPSVHDFHSEEWFGIMSLGDGSDTLMRKKRKVYKYLKNTWNRKSLSF